MEQKRTQIEHMEALKPKYLPATNKLHTRIIDTIIPTNQTIMINIESKKHPGNNDLPVNDPNKKTNKEKIKRQKTEIHTVSTIAREALERGGGRACKATHGSGCRHYGILDLKEMDAPTYSFYSKNGGWLDEKVCVVCRMGTNVMKLDKGSRSVLRYCGMGLKSVRYNRNGDPDETEIFEDHDCSMILCIPCWNSKVVMHETEIKLKSGNTERRSSARKRL